MAFPLYVVRLETKTCHCCANGADFKKSIGNIEYELCAACCKLSDDAVRRAMAEMG